LSSESTSEGLGTVESDTMFRAGVVGAIGRPS
jgi:hypothetical protein